MLSRLHAIAATCQDIAAAGWDRIAALPPCLLLAALFATFTGLSLWEMYDESLTTDELVHISAGWTYLERGDFRLNTEHPILAKALAAVPLRFMKLNWPMTDDWSQGRQWQFGFHWLFASGNDAARILFWSRLFMIPWGFLLIGSVYGISRSLFGASGAVASAVLAALLPMFLGHCHLVTTDVPVAALMLLSAWSFQKLADHPSYARSVACGAVLGIALVVKYSAVLLIPPMLWFLASRWIPQFRRLLSPGARWKVLLAPVVQWSACITLVALTSVLIIWLCYCFRFRAAAGSHFELDWHFERTAQSTPGRVLAIARGFRILPEAYLHGFWYMFENAQARPAFACGLRSPVGWWWYFPFAFLVKTPVAALVLMVTGVGRALLLRGGSASRSHFLLVPIIFYWVVACGGNIMIGLRHMMPVFPMMAVLAGGLLPAGLEGEPKAGRKMAMSFLLAFLVIEVLLSGPYYLAYFNFLSTAVAPRYKMLTDSNLDWGQDLARLRKWMVREGVPRVKLAYFGNDSCRYRGVQHERLMAANMYQQYETEWKEATPVEGGDWVAISATNYSGVVLGDNFDYFKLRFGDLEPKVTIGHSILLYHLPEHWTPPPGVPR